MKAIAAREAKNRFGTLMDTAQREPVGIEKHGCPVAVLMSVKEYKTIKFSWLQAELKAGIDQLDGDQSTVFGRAELGGLFEGIKRQARSTQVMPVSGFRERCSVLYTMRLHRLVGRIVDTPLCLLR